MLLSQCEGTRGHNSPDSSSVAFPAAAFSIVFSPPLKSTPLSGCGFSLTKQILIDIQTKKSSYLK